MALLFGKKEEGDKMKWTNILKRKRSKHHTSRKFRRGRMHPADIYSKRGVPKVGAMHDSKAEARKDNLN